MDDLITVREFAEAAGVSVQAIYKHLRNEGDSLRQYVVTGSDDDDILIHKDGLKQFRTRRNGMNKGITENELAEVLNQFKTEVLNQVECTNSNTEPNAGAEVMVLNRLIDTQAAEIERLTAQLDTKDAEIIRLHGENDRLHDDLQNAQALHLHTQEQLRLTTQPVTSAPVDVDAATTSATAEPEGENVENVGPSAGGDPEGVQHHKWDILHLFDKRRPRDGNRERP